MKYVLKYSELVALEGTQLQKELDHLARWLQETGIDPDFDQKQHVYTSSTGDRWILLPELTERQLFAMSLIVSSSELYLDNKPYKPTTQAPNKSQFED
jgi:hypothetical protein